MENIKEKEKGWIDDTLAGKQKVSEKCLAFAKASNDVFIWTNGKSPFEKHVFHYEKNHYEKNIKSLDYSYDDKKLLVACIDRLIILDTIDYKEQKYLNFTFSEEENVMKGLFSWSSYDIYLSILEKNENFIKIYDGLDASLKKKIKPSYQQFSSFMVEPSKDYLIFIYEEMLSLFKPQEEKEKVICSRKATSRYYYVNKNSDLYIYENNNFDVYYNFLENSTLFMENRDNLKKLLNNGNKESINNFNYEVCPFNFNALQIYAYDKGYMKDKENLLEIKGLPIKLFFAKDVHQRNCFDIIINTEEANVFNYFLNYILKNSSMQELYVLSESRCFDTVFFKKIMRMFEDSPKFIISFLDFIFSEHMYFPKKYSFKSLKNCIVTINDVPTLVEEKIKKIFIENKSAIDEESSIKEIVNAKCLYCNSFLDYNNEATIEVFKGISQFEPTNEIFSHMSLIKILQYKWATYARRIYFIEALNFLIFLGIYILNADYFLILRLVDESNGEVSQYHIYSLLSTKAISFFFLNFHKCSPSIRVLFFLSRSFSLLLGSLGAERGSSSSELEIMVLSSRSSFLFCDIISRYKNYKCFSIFFKFYYIR